MSKHWQPGTGCPLCGDVAFAVRSRIAFDRIWEWYGEEWGVTFSPQLRASLTPAEVTELRRCEGCGLDYFSPAIAGGGAFHDELIAANASAYVEDKWDFEQVLSRVSPGERLLDIGAGNGAFLAKAARRGIVGEGLELNHVGAGMARQRGATIHMETIEAFAPTRPASFDVVCSFQVLEHLKEPRPFLAAAWAALKPGGRLYLTVPNRDRPAEDLTSFEHPPHHLTRWSAGQLPALAEMLEAASSRVEIEPPSLHQILLAMRRRRPGSVPVKILSRILTARPLAWLWTGALTRRMGLCGHSLLVEIVKPA